MSLPVANLRSPKICPAIFSVSSEEPSLTTTISVLPEYFEAAASMLLKHLSMIFSSLRAGNRKDMEQLSCALSDEAADFNQVRGFKE